MIFDRLSNFSVYAGMPVLFVRALKFLRETELLKIPIGRHEIDGTQLYVMAQEYEPKPQAEGMWEAHEKYWDVHVVADGAERLGFSNIQEMQIDKPYDDEKEVAFYKGDGNFLTLRPGLFALMTTNDAHMPGVALDAGKRVRKIVVKVAREKA